MAFCPKCGEEAVDVFCEEHLREQKPLIEEVKPFELVLCSTCDRFLRRGSWEEFKRFEHFVKRHCKLGSDSLIEYVHVPLPVFVGKPEDFDLVIEVAGTASPLVEPYVEEYVLHVPVTVDQCDRCSQAKSGYFEGVLQLRNPRKEVISYIEESLAAASDARITKAKDVKGGIDFEVNNQQFLVSFVHNLQKAFGGVVRKSSRLHTYDHQRSKKVYRLTCLLQLPSFWTGDVIETRKRLVLVTRMGSLVKGFDLRRRKNTSLACPSDDEFSSCEVLQASVSRTQPAVMLLSPHDYQEVALSHPASVDAGSVVDVVEDSSGKWYIAKRLVEE